MKSYFCPLFFEDFDIIFIYKKNVSEKKRATEKKSNFSTMLYRLMYVCYILYGVHVFFFSRYVKLWDVRFKSQLSTS
jgi:hypothetical protein